MSSQHISQDIRSERVSFDSGGDRLVGDLYLPVGEGPFPALVVTGAWRTVKEQMPSTYAREMAKRGYAALAFDFAGWGESAGRPRGMEDPLAKADDIVAAAAYLSSRAEISVVGGLGVCASSAYLATAATKTDTIVSVALVAPALPNHYTVVAALGGEAGVAMLSKIAVDAQAHYAQTGEEQLVAAVQPNEKNTQPGADYYTNPKRGLIPEWSNSYNPAAWPNWLAYDAQASATELHQPLFIVHSEAAEAPMSVHEYVTRRPEHTDELWLDGVTQFDFYDKPASVAAAAEAAAGHFARTLTHR